MKRLEIPRSLANALLAELQRGHGQGWIGARAGIPCSLYPAEAGMQEVIISQLAARAEELFGSYGSKVSHDVQGPWHFQLAEVEKGVMTLGVVDNATDRPAELVLRAD